MKERCVNRATLPTKHVLVCEDDLNHQRELVTHFHQAFGAQGPVLFSFVSGGLHAMLMIQRHLAPSPSSMEIIDLILLDYDMPRGNGEDLLTALKNAACTIPVLTMSGLPHNNDRLMELGADYRFMKHEIVSGKADTLIKQLLGLERVPVI